MSDRFQRLKLELYKAQTKQKVTISDSWDRNRTFRFQTVETKPNVPISDSWDQTEQKSLISDSWDQTERKTSDFRQLGTNRTKKFRFQIVGIKLNIPISDARFGPNCLKSERFVKVNND